MHVIIFHIGLFAISLIEIIFKIFILIILFFVKLGNYIEIIMLEILLISKM